jgi:TolB-like protein
LNDQIRFGDFFLDLARGQLSRDGRPVPLRARACDILRVLVAAAGEVVTKDQLMAQVWPKQVVEENTLQVHISALRKALGEDVGGQRFIATVAGRGYRFIADKSKLPKETTVRTNREPPSIPQKPSIAVLPFQNMSGDVDQDYFADGIVEDITTALSRMRWLFVIARNSSFSYKGRLFDAREVGRQLGVRYLLEGSVRKTRNRIRITAQLIDATVGSHLWADRFDGDLDDIFDLQDRVSSCVVGAISPKLEEAEIRRSKYKPTENLDAYDLFLRGVASVHQLSRESISTALNLFESATKLDPDFALANGMAAWCYVQRKANGWLNDPRLDALAAVRLARQAIDLGRDDPDALHRAGHALAYLGLDHDAGATFVKRALTLNPNLALGWFSSTWINVWMGQPEPALEHIQNAMRLSPVDPLMPNMLAAMAYAHLFAGNYDAASNAADQALQEKGNYHVALRVAAASHALAGRPDPARRTVQVLQSIDPRLRIATLKNQTPLRRQVDRDRYEEGLRKAGLPE